MAFDINTVKAYGGGGSDAMMQAEIDAFNESTYPCLVASYSQLQADRIANLYMSGSLDGSEASGAVKGETSANGSSVQYDTTGKTQSISNLDKAYEADTAGCLPPRPIPESPDDYFAFGTAGTTPTADNPQ